MCVLPPEQQDGPGGRQRALAGSAHLCGDWTASRGWKWVSAALGMAGDTG